jgi:hypothetical protein
MVEDTGSTPFSCFYDNITLTAIVPTSSYAASPSLFLGCER